MGQIALAAALLVVGFFYYLAVGPVVAPLAMMFVGCIWLLYAIIRAAVRPRPQQ